MKFFAARRVIALSFCIAVSIATLYLLELSELAFHDKQWLSGWLMVVMVCPLMAYNLRKKLSFLPLVSSAVWFQWHVYAGLFVLIIFVSHISGKMAEGFFASILTVAFLTICLTGFIGVWLSRVLSKRLSRYGEQLIFERIPATSFSGLSFLKNHDLISILNR